MVFIVNYDIYYIDMTQMSLLQDTNVLLYMTQMSYLTLRLALETHAIPFLTEA